MSSVSVFRPLFHHFTSGNALGGSIPAQHCYVLDALLCFAVGESVSHLDDERGGNEKAVQENTRLTTEMRARLGAALKRTSSCSSFCV